MSRTWKTIGLAALSLSLLAAVSGRAEEPPPKPTVEQQLADLQNELRSLNKKLQASFDGINNDLATLKPLTTATLRLTEVEEAIKGINARMDNIQNSVRDLDRTVRA